MNYQIIYMFIFYKFYYLIDLVKIIIDENKFDYSYHEAKVKHRRNELII